MVSSMIYTADISKACFTWADLPGALCFYIVFLGCSLVRDFTGSAYERI